MDDMWGMLQSHECDDGRRNRLMKSKMFAVPHFLHDFVWTDGSVHTELKEIWPTLYRGPLILKFKVSIDSFTDIYYCTKQEVGLTFSFNFDLISESVERRNRCRQAGWFWDEAILCWGRCYLYYDALLHTSSYDYQNFLCVLVFSLNQVFHAVNKVG